MNILVVGAMGKEIEALINDLNDLKQCYTNIDLYSGKLDNKEIFVLKSGIGKINAAYSLTKALMILENLDKKIDFIINIGLVGATKSFKIGNVYMAEKNTLSDFDLSIFNEYYEVFNINEKYKHVANLLNIETAFVYTQDKFVSTLLENINFEYLTDMELSSLWDISKKEKIEIISLKYVSDHILKDDQLDTYKKNKNIKSSLVLLDYLKKLILEIEKL